MARTSKLDTAKHAADTAAMGARPQKPKTRPPTTGPPIPVTMLSWLVTATACSSRAGATTCGTADCTQGW